jgi:hypothetical protein
MVAAVWFLLNRVAPPDDLPWLARRTPGSMVRRAAVLVAGIPLAALAAVADQVIGVWVRATDQGNAYRVLARRIT